jgi:hypothetical protein
VKPCAWCRSNQVADAATYCGRKCRQAAFRLRRRSGQPSPTARAQGDAGRFAYYDPPYPGFASYYKDQPTFAGEVDHVELIAKAKARYQAGELVGWALSTHRRSLRYCLNLIDLDDPEVIVCPWVKPNGVSSKTNGLHNTWEPLIVVGGRRRPPGLRDWLIAKPARLGGSTLIGRKPIAFCAFLFSAMGMEPGDELEDAFPGSGIVGRAWASLSAGAERQLSLLQCGRQGVVAARAATTEAA